MGLSHWKNSPKGAIRKPDVTIAKNYLDEKYRALQDNDYISDFDREVSKLIAEKKQLE
jgi:hypothetical protein